MVGIFTWDFLGEKEGSYPHEKWWGSIVMWDEVV